MELEKFFTRKQVSILKRYKKGEMVSFKELESIPSKFWEADGQGLNMKFIDEKMREDKQLIRAEFRERFGGGNGFCPGG